MSDRTVDRPAMPVGYGISPDPAGRLPWADVERQLAAARSYWVCTTRPDGRPHAMPVWGLWLDDAVAFSTDPTSVKGRNLARDPRVVVHLESGDDVVIVEGSVEPLPESAAAAFTSAYAAKYDVTVEPGAAGTYLVRPRSVLAWREADFPASATRFRFDSG